MRPFEIGQRRLLRDIIDRAGKGVMPVERADRPLDHLDTLYVGEADVDRGVVRNIHAVDEHADIRVAGTAVQVGLAADDRVHAEFGTAAGDRQTGGEVRKVAQVAHLVPLQRGGIERGDGQRHVLQFLRPVARSDDDVVARAAVRRGIGRRRLRLRDRRAGGTSQDGAREQTRQRNAAGLGGCSCDHVYPLWLCDGRRRSDRTVRHLLCWSRLYLSHPWTPPGVAVRVPVRTMFR